MATSIQIKRGVTAKVSAYVPLEGELVLDLTTKKLFAGDGTTPGGNPVVGSRKGVADGSNAPAGEIGEVLTSTTSNVAVSSAAAVNLTSLTLTPGDWDVKGVVRFDQTANGTTAIVACLNTSSATLAPFPDTTQINGISAGGNQQFSAPTKRYSISTNTTVYLVGICTFSTGTVTGRGFIEARRAR